MEPVIRERWFDLSLPEQMVNIGNEVKRAVRFDEDNQKKRAFIKKALEGLHGGSCIELYQRADKGLLSEFYISFVK